MLSIVLLILFIFLAYKASPRESKEHEHVHGAGQIGLLAALALFGVDFFTSYYYATGEMMHVLHPYGLQNYAYVTAGVIAFTNFTFGALYMYSLGPFHEGGGSYTASMRYLWPTVSLIVAITLVEDYVLTIVVSALSGGDQLLSIVGLYGKNWLYHFGLGAVFAAATWYLTIRGRGESARSVFTLLSIFVMLTITMGIGLYLALVRDVPPLPPEGSPQSVSLAQALLHLLTAAMKGMVALTGLEAVSNGVQFMIDDDAPIVKWGRKNLPRMQSLWNFYSGRPGIARFVQTSFLFYGGVTTYFLTFFALRFDAFDGTLGRTLVGNLAHIGFSQIPGGTILFWAYQILAVLMLSTASMTAFQDAQATEWRDVAIGEIPEAIIYRDRRGTFTRSVTITFVMAVIIMALVRGQTTHAIPFYTIGVFLPITAMGLAIRKHILSHTTGRTRKWGAAAAGFSAILSMIVFLGQIFGKWEEGGWIRLITFSTLLIAAHLVLLSPVGYRHPQQIHRIVRDKARVQGAMASIVEWQAFKMQEYRFQLMIGIASFLELFGVGQISRRLEPVSVLAQGQGRALQMKQVSMTQSKHVRKSSSSLPRGKAAEAHALDITLEHYSLPPRTLRHRIIVPVNAVHQGTLTALRYAHSLSNDVTAVHVSVDPGETDAFKKKWETWGEGVRLVILDSAHGMLLEPLLEYILSIMALRQHNETITIAVPQSIRPRWWANLMRTNMAVLLRLSLPFETGVVITDVPYQLEPDQE